MNAGDKIDAIDFMVLYKEIQSLHKKLDTFIETKNYLISLREASIILGLSVGGVYARMRTRNLEPEVEYMRIKRRWFLSKQGLEKLRGRW
ncbi:hypothetical protein [Helicobacter sp. 11S02596-1]|uniref:hypothetical protein n=1 Tax=Helicobacter sp. 11S02596-1 TaxID=1476194 RepID=UPI000BA5F872|nr:hypothetical protein [Helicobacter sp. 11S02596-1]PAF41072.1 hypothetical protein BJI48_09105 [Helicobacter sp. 11S02596-1]